MGLPILSHPTFELSVPSTGEKLKYRPFLVREEKILLLAQASNEVSDMFNAIEQVLTNCVVDYDVSRFTTFDTEFVFLNLRANSVSQTTNIRILDDDTEEYLEVDVDLNDIECVIPDTEKIIDVNEEVQIEMRYPTYKDLISVDQDIMGTLTKCIDKVYISGGDVLDIKDFTDEEIDEFVNSIPSDAFNKMQEFFNGMPAVTLDVDYKVGKKKKTKTLRGIADFFS